MPERAAAQATLAPVTPAPITATGAIGSNSGKLIADSSARMRVGTREPDVNHCAGRRWTATHRQHRELPSHGHSTDGVQAFCDPGRLCMDGARATLLSS